MKQTAKRTAFALLFTTASGVLSCQSCDPPPPKPHDPTPVLLLGKEPCDPAKCNDKDPCNGEETCSSDEHNRCIPGEPPCAPGKVCRSTDDGYECEDCVDGADHDGDGSPCEVDCYDSPCPSGVSCVDHASPHGNSCPQGCEDCTGAQCEHCPNQEPCVTTPAGGKRRTPGKSEVCMSFSRDRYTWQNWTDEDCTIGVPYNHDNMTHEADWDRDGRIDAYCINMADRPAEGDTDREFIAGDDCDDYNATEICDRIDNDCDGEIDEGLDKLPYYADCDSDGFRAYRWTEVMECGSPDFMDATPKGCQDSGEVQWTTNTEVDCDDGDPNKGQRQCNAEVNETTSTGCTQCTQGEAYLNPLSRMVKKCRASDCAWGACESSRDNFILGEDWISSAYGDSVLRVPANRGLPIKFFATTVTLVPGSYKFSIVLDIDQGARVRLVLTAEVETQSGQFETLYNPSERTFDCANPDCGLAAEWGPFTTPDDACSVVRISATKTYGPEMEAALFVVRKD